MQADTDTLHFPTQHELPNRETYLTALLLCNGSLLLLNKAEPVDREFKLNF
jgi:hypothetical protein